MVAMSVYYEHLKGTTNDDSLTPMGIAFLLWAAFYIFITWKNGNKWRYIAQEYYEVSGGCDVLSVAVLRS
jgi:hypothetical protein